MDVYLCIGQSNMAGRAEILEEDREPIKNVFLFNGEENIWEIATNPLNKYSTVRKKISMQKLGPTYGFAKTMIDHHPKQKIGLIVNAKGGTSIREWKPGGLLYSEAIKQTKKALDNRSILKGVIWHQGETDASKHKEYMSKLIELITALRKDLNIPNLPFIAGQLSDDKPKRKKFNDMILSLTKNVKYTKVVSSENTSTIDKTHFDNNSQKILGVRYAQKILELINQNQ